MSTAIRFEKFQAMGGGKALLSPLSATCQYGEIVGIQAPSGGGKSTLLQCLDHWGQHQFLGQSQALGSVQLASDTACLPQGVGSLVGQLSAQENAALGGLAHTSWWKMLLGLPKPQLEQARERLRRFQMNEPEKKVELLSGGEKQRVLLARLTMTPKRILIIDEPVSQMDKAAAELCLKELAKWIKKRGACALLVSHDSRQLNLVCDRQWIWDEDWSFR